ncbi:MAG: bifunctional NAD(P)H-hydrate repair enzyme Nnr [Melioribacteraceae bacterium]|nr:MAG: bifunctional NAD(P)H-hydrate repair enzyme Nnr [Melioribacteraceae bacterium]
MKKLFDSSQIREADNFAIQQQAIPGIILMENAALNIYHVIEEILSSAGGADINSIGILCGKGNNGGDGYAVARHLVNAGYPVDIIAFADETELKGDALINYKICKNYLLQVDRLTLSTYSSISSLESISNSNVIIDALLGTGASGSLREPYSSVIKIVNELPALKVAIDAPTGLDCNTGRGEDIFKADVTVTLGGLKKGLFIEDGAANSGEVFLGGIGIGDEYFDSLSADTFLVEEEDAQMFLPQKRSGIHKYSAGKVIVLGGSGELPGAGLFAASGAFLSGAGAVISAFPKSIKGLAFNQLNGPTVKTYDDNNSEFFSVNNLGEITDEIDRSDVLIIGPGLGRNEKTIEGVRKIVEKYPSKPMVIDADALYALANYEWKNYQLDHKVFTPHHGEFASLMGIDTNELKKNILEYGREFVAYSGSILVLKGAPTVVFDIDGSAYVNPTGNRGMAKFGTGDVLTGIIGSFMAQGNEIIENVIAAVYIHSLAGDLAAEELSIYSITPDALMKYFSPAILKVNNANL